MNDPKKDLIAQHATDNGDSKERAITGADSKSELKKDIDRRRITNLYYPTEKQEFTNKSQIKACKKENELDKKVTIDSKIVAVRIKVASFDHFQFSNCNFHYEDGKKVAVIENITFRKCSFMNCILGNIVYKRVKFKDCKFYESDFMNAEFIECIFEDCEFSTCTAFDAVFDRTEVNPVAFMNGHCFPDRKYLAAKEKHIKKAKKEWRKVELRLAYQIYGSNSNIYHREYSDAGLYLVKKKEYSARKYIFGKPILGVNLKLTKGLTSLRRTLLIGLATFLFWLGLFFTFNLKIEFDDIILTQRLSVDNGIEISIYFISLFLGFGFTFFKAFSLKGWAFLILVATSGLVWYALVLSVIIRRFYK